MSENLLSEINLDYFRERFIEYTRKAFQMLPKLEKPRILDVGCGSGLPTIELAKLSDGEKELVPYVEDGWDIVRELSNGRFLVKKPNHTTI